MSNIKELIRREIERRKNKAETIRERGAYLELLSFLDTLPDESEQPTRGYDEAYLNEKIAKASKSWEGVDVDKFMDEVRGREPVTDCHDLKEAAEKSARQYYVDGGYSPFPNTEMASHIAGFKAVAAWQKRKMMEGAVETDGEVCKLADRVWITPTDEKMFHQDVFDNFKSGDKVRIIILPKED